jgi:carotenoid cleavage dioxygenase
MASTVETSIRSTLVKGITKLADFNRRRLPPVDDHPFLSGIHEPMRAELTLADLPVTGVIPPIFDGRYLRIGPNPIAPDPASHHWFAGDGMVHGVALKDGRAEWYRNRWIRSQRVAKLLDERPAPGPRHGGFDTVNTNVIGIDGRTWALVEAGSYPVELSDTLEEQTYNPFDDTLRGSFTAHPHRDPLTGEHHAIAYEGTNQSTIRHIVLSPEGRAVREEPIAVTNGPSIHDCGLTARFVLILDLPVTFSMKTLIAGHSFPYRWNPDHQARVGLLPRDGGNEDVIWCRLDPVYVFHVVNSYDLLDGRVVMDVVAYDTMFDQSNQGPDGPGRLERWTIDPAQRSVERQIIDASPQEFPRVDERLFGRPYRYCYTITISPKPSDKGHVAGTCLYKHDLEAGSRQVHDFGPDRHPGEFNFVPAGPAAEEDEGYLIGLVVDMSEQVTELVILDSRRFGEPPVASVRIPHRIPSGFHGNWVPATG